MDPKIQTAGKAMPSDLGNGAVADIIRQKVQKILDEIINPALAAHGGEIVLFDVQGGTVFLQMSGGCQGCGMANFTLREGVEAVLRREVPGIEGVRDITDHADGRDPYYTPASTY
jgi:Fe-S cluster biogenesis protein NfuA